MIGRMRRAMMSGGSRVSRSLDVIGCVGLCGQTDGATPLYIASQKGHVEAVRALVELGAAVNHAKVVRKEGSFWMVVCTHLTVCVLCVSVLLWGAGTRGCRVCGSGPGS